MGIPKFFRYISERWPMILQLIENDQIPEFDNLYLDMNSILHTCTHGNDTSAENDEHLSEEEVYAKIFTYIDHLFNTIKPKKIFYMAIDGVAPRAKMNQQRSRRFRTAMDAEKLVEKAVANEDMEEVARLKRQFDSNSITPGTEFMAKLTKNIKFFIHDKISNDRNWQSTKIIFSGHEVPGEGEHKIMDFIRTIRSSNDYNPNTRHCIYGLDADLIMLGLSAHDPHFALLREEVTFGRQRKNNGNSSSLEKQNFYLLHISLLREYLNLEFKEISDELQFKYDFERILDDFILIMFVIGNDFLPNLPDLHLNKGAFPVILQTFKESLLHLDGHINENGKINLQRLKIWLNYLSQFELMNFEKKDIDIDWFNKQLENISLQGEIKRIKQGKKLLLKQQKKLIGSIKPWLIKLISIPIKDLLKFNESDLILKLNDENIFENIEFLKELSFELNLILMKNEKISLKFDLDSINPNEIESEHLERIKSIKKTFKKYNNAILVEDQDELDNEQKIYDERFENWKIEYYKDKLNFYNKEKKLIINESNDSIDDLKNVKQKFEYTQINDDDKLIEMTENYIEGLQWVLYYYYRGCPSWSWYYKYHYAPRISDLSKGLNLTLNFDKSHPFTPFQQLMAVLPERSKNLIPVALRPLMYDENSSIIDFYPNDVELDKNGKTADWEAVVLLPFVDESRLINAMEPYLSKLSPEEKIRNSFGMDLTYQFNQQIDEVYKSPLKGVFSDIEHNHCVELTLPQNNLQLHEINYGLLPDAKFGKELLSGFPSLETIPYEPKLLYNETLVFQQPSRQQSMVLKLKNVYDYNNINVDDFAKRHLGNIIYTKWPYLRESKLIEVQSKDKFLTFDTRSNKVKTITPTDFELKDFKSLKDSMNKNYKKKNAVDLGKVDVIVKVLPVNGLIRNSSGAYVKTFVEEPEFYPLQLVVETIVNVDERYIVKPPQPIDKEFPLNEKVIFLGDYAYGGTATIDGYSSSTRLKLTVEKRSMRSEPNIGKTRNDADKQMIRYIPSFVAAKQLNLNSYFLSRITSKYLVADINGKHLNVGIPIKFEARREKVLGYSKRSPKGWSYSNLAIDLLKHYKLTFPDFFNRLSNMKKGGNGIPSIEELYPELRNSEASKILASVCTWIKTVTDPFVNVSLESDSLSKASICMIEEAIIPYSLLPDQSETKQLTKVPREAILDPKESTTLLRTQRFDLGDRVVYVQSSGKVPLFSKGTVVGYTTLGTNLNVQVLFDNEIVAGNKFGGRLMTNRGIGLDASYLLNISNCQFVYHSKASKNNAGEKNQKKQTQLMEAHKERAARLQTARAKDLLTHINSDEKEAKSNEDKQQLPGQVNIPPPNRVAANHLYSAVLNNVNGNVPQATQIHPINQQPMPTPGFVPTQAPTSSGPGAALPYHLPPAFVPTSMPPNGMPPQMFPQTFHPMQGPPPGVPQPLPHGMPAPGMLMPQTAAPQVNEQATKDLKSAMQKNSKKPMFAPSNVDFEKSNRSNRSSNRGRKNQNKSQRNKNFKFDPKPNPSTAKKSNEEQS